MGEVDDPGEYQLLRSSVALLNPLQWSEPFGLSMIEALACGTPVVAASAGSDPEILGDGRTGSIRDDAAGLAEALRQANTLIGSSAVR